MVKKLQPLKHGARQDSAIVLTNDCNSGNSESDSSSNESGDNSKSAISDDSEVSLYQQSQDNLSEDRQVAHDKEKEKKRKRSKDGKKGKENTKDKKKKIVRSRLLGSDLLCFALFCSAEQNVIHLSCLSFA
ncbi:unnamed protein product [Calypogeia fissa]